MTQQELTPLLGLNVRAMVRLGSGSAIPQSGVIARAANNPSGMVGMRSAAGWHLGNNIESIISMSGFIVLLVLMGGGSWQPVFHEDDKQMFFVTRKEAQTAIDECIADVKEAVAKGDMSDEYTQDDYTIAPAVLEGTTIHCSWEGVDYAMDRGDDDWKTV